MKEIIRVFPDYCSSGLWSETGNVEPEELGITDAGIILALKYWHWIWEFEIAKSEPENWEFDHRKFHGLSDYGVKVWKEDGQKIVDELNTKYGDKYEFVYDIDEWVV